MCAQTKLKQNSNKLLSHLILVSVRVYCTRILIDLKCSFAQFAQRSLQQAAYRRLFVKREDWSVTQYIIIYYILLFLQTELDLKIALLPRTRQMIQSAHTFLYFSFLQFDDIHSKCTKFFLSFSRTVYTAVRTDFVVVVVASLSA